MSSRGQLDSFKHCSLSLAVLSFFDHLLMHAASEGHVNLTAVTGFRMQPKKGILLVFVVVFVETAAIIGPRGVNSTGSNYE